MDQMPSICHLKSRGSAKCGSKIILPTPISTNELDIRMRLEPGGCGGSRTVRQHIDHLMSFQIDENTAISKTTSKGEVVYPNFRDPPRRKPRCCFESSEHR